MFIMNSLISSFHLYNALHRNEIFYANKTDIIFLNQVFSEHHG